MSTYAWVTFVLASSLAFCFATLQDAKDLHADLLVNYNKYVRPVKDQATPVYVFIQLSAIAIQEFDEVLERFSIAGAFIVYWKDDNIDWKPSDYGGVTTVFMGYSDVWVPEIILTNPSEKLDSYGKAWQKIRYDSTGVANWTPGDLIKATCSINVRYFPFDIQHCDLELFTWGYLASEVKLISIRDDIETGLLSEHSSWKVINTSAVTEDTSYVSKITFTFKLERKPQYIIINVVLPILFLCLLNVLVFLLPSESGERVSYSITVLLSIAVFMTIVSSTLPKSSEPLPLIAYFLMIDLIISALISVFTILNLRVFHKTDDPVPRWLTYIYYILTCNCRRNRTIVPGPIDTTANSTAFKNIKTMMAESNTDKCIKPSGLQSVVPGAESEASFNETAHVSWPNISSMFDAILFIFFTLCTAVSFITLLVITTNQTF